MKTTIISYSMTGNNDKLASGIASKLNARHIRITEPKKRTNGTIALDMLLNRKPKINESMDDVDTSGLVLLFAPVWMGKVASPLRGVLKELKPRIEKYAFISLSGGADGPNPKLSKELKNRLGRPPEAVIDMHIADLLPSDPKPTRQNTSDYRLDNEDAETLIGKAMRELGEID